MQPRAPQTDAKEPADSPAGPGADSAGAGRDGSGLGWALLTAIVVTLTILSLQTLPTNIDNNGDISLGAVLNYAQAHHWQFGRDLVFTYGPLGYLTFFYYWPHAAWARLATVVVVCFATAAGVSLVAWRLRIWWRVLLLGLFAFAASNIDPRTDLVFDTGLFCWGLLCFIEHGRRLAVCVGVLAIMAVFTALAKTSYLFVGAVTVLIVATDQLAQRRWGRAAGALGGYIAAWVCGWTAAGQQFGTLGAFLKNTAALIAAYNHGLGWEGSVATRQAGMLLGPVAIPVIILGAWNAFSPNELRGNGGERAHPNRQLNVRRGILFLWLLIFTFVVWKHSFFRADFFHAAFFIGFAPVLGLGLGALPGRQGTVAKCRTGTGLGFVLLAVISLQWYFLPSFSKALTQPFQTIAYSARTLVRPTAYWATMNAAVESMREAAQLPKLRQIVGHSTVDFFGLSQVYVLLNDLNYRTAPVFQSYAVCSERLAQLDESFYLSESAPEYVIFTLWVMDRKFASLDNSRVLRDLLINYEPVATEKGFLLLKRKAREQPRLTLLRAGVVGPGDPIDLRSYGETNLWLEIDLKPNLAGQLREAVYRAPTVRLAVWREPGKGLLYRQHAPWSNLKPGFIASPLLERTEDVENLYEGKPGVRPGAYSVHMLKGEEWWWKKQIGYRLYRMDNPIGNKS